MSRVKITFSQFEERFITTVMFNGELFWFAHDIGNSLGYGDEGWDLVRKVSDPWYNELVEGIDHKFLKVEDLVEINHAIIEEFGVEDFNSYFTEREMTGFLSPHFINSSLELRGLQPVALLYPGLDFICAQKQKPVGKKLKKFIVKEIIPQFCVGEVLQEVPAMEVSA